MTCRLDWRKSITRSPLEFLMYASRMFHSFGIVQSNTWVPVGTLVVRNGIRRAIRSRVARIPCPVMLRQIGYNSAANECSEQPNSAASFSSSFFSKLMLFEMRFGIEVGIITVAIGNHLRF